MYRGYLITQQMIFVQRQTYESAATCCVEKWPITPCHSFHHPYLNPASARQRFPISSKRTPAPIVEHSDTLREIQSISHDSESIINIAYTPNECSEPNRDSQLPTEIAEPGCPSYRYASGSRKAEHKSKPVVREENGGKGNRRLRRV